MTYIADPANYVMKANPVKAEAIPSPGEALSIPEADTLAEMDKDALVALCMRMARQCGLVAAMTEEETAQAMLDTLAHTALKPIVLGLNMKADIQNRLNSIDKWLDRTRGKPAQSINMRGVIDNQLNVTIRLAESTNRLPLIDAGNANVEVIDNK